MLKITPCYKICKDKTKNTLRENSTAINSNVVLHTSLITSLARDNDGLSQTLLLILWVCNSCFQKTLLDSGSLVELINWK